MEREKMPNLMTKSVSIEEFAKIKKYSEKKILKIFDGKGGEEQDFFVIFH